MINVNVCNARRAAMPSPNVRQKQFENQRQLNLMFHLALTLNVVPLSKAQLSEQQFVNSNSDNCHLSFVICKLIPFCTPIALSSYIEVWGKNYIAFCITVCNIHHLRRLYSPEFSFCVKISAKLFIDFGATFFNLDDLLTF